MTEVNKTKLQERILRSKELTALEKRYLKNLVTADGIIKIGTWVNTNTPNHLRCTCCDVIHFIAQYPRGRIAFCPNCGAKMIEKEDQG